MSFMATGGAGFIGSHIVDYFAAQGCAVTVFDDLSSGKRQNLGAGVTIAVGDVRDPKAVAAALIQGTDTLFHLAAQIDVHRAVDDLAIDILRGCGTAGIRPFVMSSTGGALYAEPAVLPATEETVIRPLSPYGVSKYCAEWYVGYFDRTYWSQTVILRYANVYGPRQDPNGEAGVVGIFARCILLGQVCVVYGDGEQTSDFVFVGDVAQANMLATQGPVGMYNIGTGLETSLNGLLAGFEHMAGHPVVRERCRE